MPLVSRNEVGGGPDRPLVDALARFHRANEARAARWPVGLVCTNTHDAKRSADVRARIDVLSEMPEVWWERVRRWRTLNHPHRVALGRRSAPDPNTEYLFYQVLLGIWPPGLPGDALPDQSVLDRLAERVDAYMVKAGREGKSRTSWVEPVGDFEEATGRFVREVLRSPPFLRDFAQFATRALRPALWGSLARVALHLTIPGTPDTYQGDELWCFALVDPDNRRPIDYEVRERLLESLAGESTSGASIDPPEDSGTKLQLVHALLRARRDRPSLFAAGDYVAIEATGTHASHVIAFARAHGEDAALVVVPRFAGSLVGGREAPIGSDLWTDTTIPLPRALSGRRWRSALTGGEVGPAPTLRVGDLLAERPVGVLFG
jgi:(1->4)-alpha-D-glucan 1-alpha-D-glucosylmutase